MEKKSNTKELFFFTLIITILLIGYIVLVITKHEEESRRVGELLTIVVISLCTYYLGYSRKFQERCSKNKEFKAKYEHITKKTISRLAYIFLGIGIALIIQHVVLFGVDLEFKELLLGHEWIGLYIIILAMYLLGISKKLGD